MALRYDPELWQIIKHYPTISPPNLDDPVVFRETIDTFLASNVAGLPLPPNVAETKLEVKSLDGTTIPVYRFRPTALGNSKSAPVAILLHGGGTISGNVNPIFRPAAMQFAADSEITIYAVEYRLAPETPFPGAVEDVYATLKWLQSNHQNEKIDHTRIGIAGISAGACIAAGVTLMARDEGFEPPIAKQILICPMLDNRTATGSDHPLTEFLSWTQSNNDLGWNAYLGQKCTNVSPYAAPARAEKLEGLPRTYIDVGGLDLFRDESIKYASRLSNANIEVEFHLYPGVPHGWERLGPEISVTKIAAENRIRALRTI